MNYRIFLKISLKNEGGYVNDPDDAGLETYRGISRRSHPGWIGWKYLDAIQNKTRGQIFDYLEDVVFQFYFGNFFSMVKGNSLIEIHPLLALHVFDMAVNAGVGKASRMLQKVVKTSQDGIIGPITLAELKKDPEAAYMKYYSRRIMFYRDISTINNNRKFLGGWLKRVRECSRLFYKEVTG